MIMTELDGMKNRAEIVERYRNKVHSGEATLNVDIVESNQQYL